MALTSGARKRFSTTLKVENGEYISQLSEQTLVSQSNIIDLAIELLKKEVGTDTVKLYELLKESK